jgi:SAM-dependent methyltransferase
VFDSLCPIICEFINGKKPSSKHRAPQKRKTTKFLNFPLNTTQYVKSIQETGNVFDLMGQYWAEIADESQTQRQIQFLKVPLNREGCVLDVACGTGRHTITLCKAGFDVVGLDISVNLLRIAKTHGASVLVRGDMRFLPFKPGAFTAAISMDNSIGYLPTEKEDAQSLTEVKRVLKADGLFVLDVFNREKLSQKYNAKGTSPKLYDYPSFTLQQDRTVSVDGDWLCDHWTVKQRTDGQVRVFDHKARLYTRSRLESMLSEAGFSVSEVFGDYEQQPFSTFSPRLIIQASAKQLPL